MIKFIAISLSILALAIGWWFTTLLTIACWMGWAAASLVKKAVDGGAW